MAEVRTVTKRSESRDFFTVSIRFAVDGTDAAKNCHVKVNRKELEKVKANSGELRILFSETAVDWLNGKSK